MSESYTLINFYIDEITPQRRDN